jgi:hypothetical protein
MTWTLGTSETSQVSQSYNSLYFGKYPTLWGGGDISHCHPRENILKGKEKKGENVRKREDRGKRKEERGKKRENGK